ncbi:uncharacterized protein BDR25DRAFT_274960 [Lindgomyces ingoldianus]|uniref:Uncharacterized protein n=1 Tax=Lindgomyces ingoldianus TaxID=673940 RepID=A0ACB6RGQ9_9PLEO|nr:uncharacterized protein BDR25DRAFT_274960 [Lindgomyces ingoldianus]KAF2477651.1 hypothetical protein BDR25DRAFT_274960 [Lindgomyces ingoldianus]
MFLTMQFIQSLIAVALLIVPRSSFSEASPLSLVPEKGIPTKVIAGVTVPDTPIVQAALAFARAHADNMTFNHVMRSWLFGTIIINTNTTLRKAIDPETHAVAAILHDLGWDNTGALISSDKRFEVDGAIAAWDFIEAEMKNGTAHGWDENRKQLVWDAIALHTTPTISAYKQPVVAATGAGILSDIQGPNSDSTHTLTWEEYDRVKSEFPRLDFGPGASKIICGFARSKPATTYDTWMQLFGDRYVEGYTQHAKGKLAIDILKAALPN